MQEIVIDLLFTKALVIVGFGHVLFLFIVDHQDSIPEGGNHEELLHHRVHVADVTQIDDPREAMTGLLILLSLVLHLSHGFHLLHDLVQ